MKTFYSNIRRHRAETEIDLGDRRVLTILTCKVSDGTLASSATVSEVIAGLQRHIICRDFAQTVERSTPKRVTATVVRAQHDQALAKVEAIKLAVELHYEAQAKKAA